MYILVGKMTNYKCNYYKNKEMNLVCKETDVWLYKVCSGVSVCIVSAML